MEQINDTNHHSLVLSNNPQIDGSERKILANIFNVKLFCSISLPKMDWEHCKEHMGKLMKVLKNLMTLKNDTFRYLVLFNCQRLYNFKGFLKEILRYTFVTYVTSNNLDSFKLQ
jgi:hypothetical protein